MKSKICLKRAYDPAEGRDGQRILVDALWPRGVSKTELKIHHWSKDIAPSSRLRKWFGHDPLRWKEFRRRYSAELNEKGDTWKGLLETARENKITLVFGARDIEHNNAVVVKSYLEKKLAKKAARSRQSSS